MKTSEHMKEYFKINQLRYLGLIGSSDSSPEMTMYAGSFIQANPYFTRAGLRKMGIRSDDVENLLAAGVLKRTKVSRSVAMSLAMRELYDEDPEFRKRVKENLVRGRTTARKSPDYEKKIKASLAKATRVLTKEARRRRGILLRKVILPVYGTKTDGGYEKPETLCAFELSDLLLSEKYRDLAETLYRLTSDKGFRRTVWYDIIRLGIRPMNHKEGSKKVSAKLKRIAGNRPELLAKLRVNAKTATAARLKKINDNPESEKSRAEKQSRTLKYKMESDPKHRSHVMEALAKGNPAFRDKMDNDPEFRARMTRTYRKGLAKGVRTVKRRAERRANALYRHVIVPEFEGDLNRRIGQTTLQYLLDNSYQEFRDKYYSGTTNVKMMLKKDIRRLRERRLKE